MSIAILRLDGSVHTIKDIPKTVSCHDGLVMLGIVFGQTPFNVFCGTKQVDNEPLQQFDGQKLVVKPPAAP